MESFQYQNFIRFSGWILDIAVKKYDRTKIIFSGKGRGGRGEGRGHKYASSSDGNSVTWQQQPVAGGCK